MLTSWAASPARFREDANAEEDYALGGYRHRLVVELAQNAADAARRAGVPGHIRFTLTGGVLEAVNTGAKLDAAGVEALSTLRASDKRDEASVGRFGVGFAAVVAVSDEPSIASADGVRWSRSEAAELVAARPELAVELARREGHIPLLRLPFPASVAVPEGFDTIVRLPLRDEAAEAAVRGMLAEVGPGLLLALPDLAHVEIEVDGERRVVERGRWQIFTASGEISADLLADRPTEERARRSWQIRWAIPVDEAGDPTALPSAVPPVVHAPTPSGEPLGLPALLIASLPLAPDRRQVAPGPLTDFLIEQAAVLYVDALTALPSTPRLLKLVPGHLGAGEIDAALRREILTRLPQARLLPGDLAGRDAVVVDGTPELIGLVREVVPGLLPWGWPFRDPALGRLGVSRTELSEVIDLIAGLRRPASWWRSLYDALAGADPEAVAAVPVPLTDGRVVRGPRGALILSAESGGVDPEALAPLGLRIVDPEAAHPLLERLGAAQATPRTVLVNPITRAQVEGSLDSGDPVAEAVLPLVAAAGLRPGEEPWLADLALPDADGEPTAAGELLLPGGELDGLLDRDAPFGLVDASYVERYGVDALVAVGVLDGFAVVRDEDVLLDPHDCDHDLDLEEEWLETITLKEDDPPLCRDFLAVRDLEYVADWPAALELLAKPPLRAALTPVQPDVPSYTAWWLRNHPVLDGRRPDSLRLPSGDPLLAGLYGEATGIPEWFAGLIGVRTSLADLLAEVDGPAELLDRLGDDSLVVTRDQLRAIWTALAAIDPARISPPTLVRCVHDGQVIVAPATDAVVVEAPDLLPLLDAYGLVLASFDHAETLSEMLDLPLAGEAVAAEISSSGVTRPVPEVVRLLLPEAPAEYVEHSPLLVDDVSVPWRFAEGVVHACGDEGLARGLAWACGRWNMRLPVAALLRDPAGASALLAEADLDH
ncbi:sacsin N-terminal ATP-binding-like domain-containing protein [Rhizohabitans arisaemae]|uniref:sacsin N-terminal ATP-binding-like domain-containing protein n=1 Tax=Rhizohabitans arisaemae TaxID=2720610 RepID=UPI0031FEEE06